MRYSIDEGMIDFAKGTVVPCDELIEEMLEHVAEDAQVLGCEKELASVRDILARGTSAHEQLRGFEGARTAGASVADSLVTVVDTLIANTAEGV